MDADLMQGGSGDCYFLSPLYTLLQTVRGRKLILDLFVNKDDGTQQEGLSPWGVQFSTGVVDGRDLTEKAVQDMVAHGKAAQGQMGTLVLERFFARVQHYERGGREDETAAVGADRWLFEGGLPREAMQCLCGGEMEVGECFLSGFFDFRGVEFAAASSLSIQGISDVNANRLEDGCPKVEVEIPSGKSFRDAVGMERKYIDDRLVEVDESELVLPPDVLYKVPLVNGEGAWLHARHAYAMVDVDYVKREFTLVDPHDTASKRYRVDERCSNLLRAATVAWPKTSP